MDKPRIGATLIMIAIAMIVFASFLLIMESLFGEAPIQAVTLWFYIYLLGIWFGVLIEYAWSRVRCATATEKGEEETKSEE